MAGEVFAGLSAIKTAFDMAQGLQNIHDAVARDRAVIELQKEILAAQSAQALLIQRISDLEKEKARFETWDAEKQRYELKELNSGSFAFVLKSDAQPPEPPHQICPTCYQNRKKSILQRAPNNSARMALGMGTSYRCPVCSTEVGV